MKNTQKDLSSKIAKGVAIGICGIAYSCQPRSVSQPVAAENFPKNDSIIATDFGTYARIISVKKLDDVKYDSIALGEGSVPGFKYQLLGEFDVELTSGNDDITNTPIVRIYKNISGAVTVVDKDYSKK